MGFESILAGAAKMAGSAVEAGSAAATKAGTAISNFSAEAGNTVSKHAADASSKIRDMAFDKVPGDLPVPNVTDMANKMKDVAETGDLVPKGMPSNPDQYVFNGEKLGGTIGGALMKLKKKGGSKSMPQASTPSGGVSANPGQGKAKMQINNQQLPTEAMQLRSFSDYLDEELKKGV